MVSTLSLSCFSAKQAHSQKALKLSREGMALLVTCAALRGRAAAQQAGKAQQQHGCMYVCSRLGRGSLSLSLSMWHAILSAFLSPRHGSETGMAC